MARDGQFSRRGKRGATAALLALAALGAAPPQPEGTPSLDTLLAHFAAGPGLLASVEEEKHLSLLREPLVSHGTLAFVPPSLLVRVMREPVPSRLVIDADTLRYEVEGEEGSVEIRAHPMLRALVEGMRHLFAGDVEALRSVFEVAWLADPGDPMAWRLELRPREAAMRGRVTRIEVSGRDWDLQALRVIEVGGDETRMRFSDVDARHDFDPAEIAELLATVGGTDR